MLAFLFKNSILSKLANFLRLNDEDGYFKKFKTDCELAKALYELNVQALEEQFLDYKKMITPFKYTKEFFSNDGKRKAQAFLSLFGFLHVCSVGTVPGEKLYKKIEEFELKMAEEIAFDWAINQVKNSK